MSCVRCHKYDGYRNSKYPVEYERLCGVCEELQIAQIYEQKQNTQFAETHKIMSKILKELYDSKK